MFEEFRDKERSGWGSKADSYQDHTARITTQAIPTLLAAVRARAGAAILDICTGPGYAAGAAHAVCARAVGVDFAPEMVRAAKANFPHCTFMEGDALQLEFDDASFDAALCPFGIFHVTDPARAIAEAYRVLRLGGRYAFSQWCAPSESDFFRITMGSIAKHADMSVADPAPDAFALSDRERCRSLMEAAGFHDIEVREVPSVYHAPDGNFFENFMHLTVRGAMIVDAQTEEVVARIRQEMNTAASAYETADGVVVPVPSFVVSGRKP
ncbi:methyltransferase domain-containing protein [Rhodobacterales bacterium HKCCSP123]|nr:methyltransferase domain-containing protein [Rhodobacterales bacterium HKCCSP123]